MAQSDYRPGDLLRCRTRLLRFLLSKLSNAEIKEATVIFDARDPPPDRPAQFVVSGLKVLFANPGGDADALIQDWLSRHPVPRRVTLVSSDRVLQRAARSCGSKFIGSADFIDNLEQRSRAGSQVKGRSTSISDDSKPSGKASAAQLDYWLKVFGDVPIDELNVADQRRNSVKAAAAAKSEPQTTSKSPPRQSKNTRSREHAAAEGRLEQEERAYWLNVFGDQPPTDPAGSATDEVRLSDLENWLKEFEATEGKDDDKPRPASDRNVR